MPFCVLIPCGPEPIEVERLRDLIESVYCYEPKCREVFILNDGNTALDLLRSYHHQVLTNPRRGAGWGVGGGLVAGQLFAYRTIYEKWPDISYVLRLDTDAHIIRPFNKMLEIAFRDGTIGMIGSRISSDTVAACKVTPSLSYFRHKVSKLKAPISLWRKPHLHMRCALYGRHRRVAGMFFDAETRGYTAGELIEGGAFAVSNAWIQRAMADKAMAGDLLNIPVTEDVVMTMLTYLFDLRVMDLETFCIEPGTLRFGPEVLRENPAVAIIHSVKKYQCMSEKDIRAFFRETRERPLV